MDKNTKKIKILMLCDFYGIGQTYQENLLAKYYIELGHSVIILASTTENVNDFIKGDYNKSIKKSVVYDNGIKIIRLPYKMNILGKLRKFNNVYEIMVEEKPQLIFAHDIYFNLKDAVKYKIEYGAKIIMDYHADYSNSAKNWISLNVLHRIIRKSYFNQVEKHIDKIYPVVPDSMCFLNEIYGIPLDRMEILPLGFDSNKIDAVRDTIEIDIERAKLGINQKDIVLITGGKFNSQKKTEVAIEALNLLKDSRVHLLIFGKADNESECYENELKYAARNLNVQFLGWIAPEETYKYMLISDIAIFPASQSVLWQQCIGAHLPLIAGDTGNQDMSYLNQYDNLLKIDKENITPKFYAEILHNLITNPDRLKKMKDGAEKTAREYLDYKLIVARTLENITHDNS